MPAGQVTGQLRLAPLLPPGASLQLKVPTVVAALEVQLRFSAVGPEVGVKLDDGGATPKALALLPTNPQVMTLVACAPEPMPPLGVTRIWPEPVLPMVVTPVRLIVVPEAGV